MIINMDNSKKTILVTGVAGFIGSEVAKKLSKFNSKIIGIDNLNSYYDPELKKLRLEKIHQIFLQNKSNFIFYKKSLEDKEELEDIFLEHKPEIVINLAAQAGVRYSIENPMAYFRSNLLGFGNILELCRNFYVQNFIYASSSSVYGGNTKVPFKESDPVNHPVSLYAATKKSNELLAHTYSHLYKVPSTGLRFFTVYGPWGRPDMAPMIFTKKIFAKKSIKIFNNGDMFRDFTYIDDVVNGIIKCSFKPATPDTNFDKLKPNPSTSYAPHRIFNIGNSEPIKLMDFINVLEQEVGIEAKKEFLPMQPGDVIGTYADTNLLKEWVGFSSRTSLKEGIKKFVAWYKDFYKI